MNNLEILENTVKSPEVQSNSWDALLELSSASCLSCDNDDSQCSDCIVRNSKNIIREDLRKLVQYQELFQKIIKSDPTLEYSGKELSDYYYDIENKEKTL